MPRIRYRYVLAGCAVWALACPTLAATAGLSCEQLFAAAESVVQFRDQGYSLQQILDGLKGGDLEAKLSDDEIRVLRKTMTAVYLSNASIDEVTLACRQARGDK